MFPHSRKHKQVIIGAKAAETTLRDRQHKLHKVQREANEAERKLAQLQAKTIERSKIQEEDLSCALSDSATSSSSRDESIKEEEEKEGKEEREGGKGMGESISDANYVKRQPGSQQKANLLASGGLKIKVDVNTDSLLGQSQSS